MAIVDRGRSSPLAGVGGLLVESPRQRFVNEKVMCVPRYATFDEFHGGWHALKALRKGVGFAHSARPSKTQGVPPR